MIEPGRISISDTRTLARSYADPHSPAALALLDIIEAAEELRASHRQDCGCDFPGSPVCQWPRPEGRLLASFEFDEAVIEWP
jgi:hypothetical protein